MPLAPCPDCGNECSTLAAACPKCGRPLNAAASNQKESIPSVEKAEEQSESERQRDARERKERLASIPVSSRVVSGLNTSPAQTDRATQIGCLIVAVIFIVFALFCCSSGRKSSTYDSTYTPSSGGGSTSVPSNSGSTAPSSSNGASREDEITRRRYAECVRQRNAAGLDTSPCSGWAKER